MDLKKAIDLTINNEIVKEKREMVQKIAEDLTGKEVRIENGDFEEGYITIDVKRAKVYIESDEFNIESKDFNFCLCIPLNQIYCVEDKNVYQPYYTIVDYSYNAYQIQEIA